MRMRSISKRWRDSGRRAPSSRRRWGSSEAMKKWIAVPVFVLAGCRQQQVYQKPLTPVSVQAVTECAGDSGSRYSGNIGPNSQVTVAFKVGGYVDEIRQVAGRNLQEGDVVKQGDVLARVRQSDYQARIREGQSNLAQSTAAFDQARFAVKEAAAGEEKAKLDWTRADRLFAAQSLTKPEY